MLSALSSGLEILADFVLTFIGLIGSSFLAEWLIVSLIGEVCMTTEDELGDVHKSKNRT